VCTECVGAIASAGFPTMPADLLERARQIPRLRPTAEDIERFKREAEREARAVRPPNYPTEDRSGTNGPLKRGRRIRRRGGAVAYRRLRIARTEVWLGGRRSAETSRLSTGGAGWQSAPDALLPGSNRGSLCQGRSMWRRAPRRRSSLRLDALNTRRRRRLR
jgi:hypothetical protein